ncbi:LCP family protein [Nonomuraea soli]|uniref:LCP family protein required for cell wall assembly n=1 Tax=Nonomuraea soli TaxID=1032476 RepID=A0A7W0HPW1_9ACTN|nr:LCP family protein [Nonomuraea soli]MBA2891278.1 LCP family protein required for cell wall assembly [Nonomuraea soli]
MDDLTMLRDLGRELENEPPARLVRQRERVFRKPRPRLGWLTISLAALATAVAIAVPAVIADLRPVLHGIPATAPRTAMNVLLVGSDTREGPENARYGPALSRTDAGGRSDTLLVAHIPADRTRISVVNIPRDSLVELPRCGGGRLGMINSAYNAGGVACARETVEKLTGLRVDHTVEIDFAGLKGVVDALGGVEFTVPEDISDRQAKLELKKGRQVLNGEQALGWLRLRHLGDGTDLARIKRQQALMAAMVGQVKRSLDDPAKIKRFLDSAVRMVRTDLDPSVLYTVAGSEVKFLSVPVGPHSEDPNRLRWLQPDAQKLFDKLK